MCLFSAYSILMLTQGSAISKNQKLWRPGEMIVKMFSLAKSGKQ